MAAGQLMAATSGLATILLKNLQYMRICHVLADWPISPGLCYLAAGSSRPKQAGP
jgi:hypothetical protein